MLENFTAAERAEVPSICEQAADATELLVALGLKPAEHGSRLVATVSGSASRLHQARGWRATITGRRANITTAALMEPSNIPANPPRP